MGPVSQRGSDPNEVVTSDGHRGIVTVQILEDRPYSPTDPVPRHRVSHRAWDCERNTCVLRGVEPGNQPNRSLSGTCAFRSKSSEVVTARQSTNHAEMRARPFRRRERNTARPPRVLIRDRKPCFFARLRTFGWYVLFIVNPPKHRGQDWPHGTSVPKRGTDDVNTSRYGAMTGSTTTTAKLVTHSLRAKWARNRRVD